MDVENLAASEAASGSEASAIGDHTDGGAANRADQQNSTCTEEGDENHGNQNQNHDVNMVNGGNADSKHNASNSDANDERAAKRRRVVQSNSDETIKDESSNSNTKSLSLSASQTQNNQKSEDHDQLISKNKLLSFLQSQPQQIRVSVINEYLQAGSGMEDAEEGGSGSRMDGAGEGKDESGKQGNEGNDLEGKGVEAPGVGAGGGDRNADGSGGDENNSSDTNASNTVNDLKETTAAATRIVSTSTDQASQTESPAEDNNVHLTLDAYAVPPTMTLGDLPLPILAKHVKYLIKKAISPDSVQRVEDVNAVMARLAGPLSDYHFGSIEADLYERYWDDLNSLLEEDLVAGSFKYGSDEEFELCSYVRELRDRNEREHGERQSLRPFFIDLHRSGCLPYLWIVARGDSVSTRIRSSVMRPMIIFSAVATRPDESQFTPRLQAIVSGSVTPALITLQTSQYLMRGVQANSDEDDIGLDNSDSDLKGASKPLRKPTGTSGDLLPGSECPISKITGMLANIHKSSTPNFVRACMSADLALDRGREVINRCLYCVGNVFVWMFCEKALSNSTIKKLIGADLIQEYHRIHHHIFKDIRVSSDLDLQIVDAFAGSAQTCVTGVTDHASFDPLMDHFSSWTAMFGQLLGRRISPYSFERCAWGLQSIVEKLTNSMTSAGAAELQAFWRLGDTDDYGVCDSECQARASPLLEMILSYCTLPKSDKDWRRVWSFSAVKEGQPFSEMSASDQTVLAGELQGLRRAGFCLLITIALSECTDSIDVACHSGGLLVLRDLLEAASSVECEAVSNHSPACSRFQSHSSPDKAVANRQSGGHMPGMVHAEEASPMTKYYDYLRSLCPENDTPIQIKIRTKEIKEAVDALTHIARGSSAQRRALAIPLEIPFERVLELNQTRECKSELRDKVDEVIYLNLPSSAPPHTIATDIYSTIATEIEVFSSTDTIFRAAVCHFFPFLRSDSFVTPVGPASAAASVASITTTTSPTTSSQQSRGDGLPGCILNLARSELVNYNCAVWNSFAEVRRECVILLYRALGRSPTMSIGATVVGEAGESKFHADVVAHLLVEQHLLVLVRVVLESMWVGLEPAAELMLGENVRHVPWQRLFGDGADWDSGLFTFRFLLVILQNIGNFVHQGNACLSLLTAEGRLRVLVEGGAGGPGSTSRASKSNPQSEMQKVLSGNVIYVSPEQFKNWIRNQMRELKIRDLVEGMSRMPRAEEVRPYPTRVIATMDALGW